MGKKKPQYRYTYEIAKRWKSFDNNTAEEIYTLVFTLEEADSWSADHRAKKLAEKVAPTTNYTNRVTLKKVEEL